MSTEPRASDYDNIAESTRRRDTRKHTGRVEPAALYASIDSIADANLTLDEYP